MKIISLLLTLFVLSVFVQPQQPQSRVIALIHVTVIDMTGAPPKKDMTVVVTDDRISAIGKMGRVRVPRGARVVDATGQFLISGLWDMHAHFTETERTFPMFIANGVVGVRNTGGNAEDLSRWRKEVANGKLVGPRIIFCGPIVDGRDPAAHGPVISVGSPAEGRQAVQKLKQHNADFIKVYDQLSRDSYFAILDEANKLMLPVVGHVPVSITTVEASDAGQKSIEHLGSILEGSSTAETELRNWKQPQVKDNDYSVIPRNIAARGSRMLETYSERKASQIFNHLVKNQTWQVPTLVTKRSLALIDDLILANDERLKYIPESVQRRWDPRENFLLRYRTPEYIDYNKRLFRKEMQLVGAMHRAGVPFLTGTDLSIPYIFPGFSVHDELALLVEAGFTPLQALQAATRNPAIFLGELSSHGTVESGKLANLVLLEANPLEDIRNTQRINAVFLRGRYFSKQELQQMLSELIKK
jgi:Amidohydrolase family